MTFFSPCWWQCQVFFAILIGAFSLGQAAPNLELLQVASGAGGAIFETIDRVSDTTKHFLTQFDVILTLVQHFWFAGSTYWCIQWWRGDYSPRNIHQYSGISKCRFLLPDKTRRTSSKPVLTKGREWSDSGSGGVQWVWQEHRRLSNWEVLRPFFWKGNRTSDKSFKSSTIKSLTCTWWCLLNMMYLHIQCVHSF